jgi:hypothetical protein
MENPQNQYIASFIRILRKKMSSGTRQAQRYSYGLWRPATVQETVNSEEMSRDEALRFVKMSLGLLTAGCEQCEYSDRLFCTKYRKPIKVNDSRCESFERRPTAMAPDFF